MTDVIGCGPTLAPQWTAESAGFELRDIFAGAALYRDTDRQLHALVEATR